MRGTTERTIALKLFDSKIEGRRKPSEHRDNDQSIMNANNQDVSITAPTSKIFPQDYEYVHKKAQKIYYNHGIIKSVSDLFIARLKSRSTSESNKSFRV